MRVTVDADACIGCGICTETCPDVFKVTDDDKAVAEPEEVPAELEEVCREAAEECPVEAILVE